MFTVHTCSIDQLNSHLQPQVRLIIWAQLVKGIFVDVVPTYKDLYEDDDASNDVKIVRVFFKGLNEDLLSSMASHRDNSHKLVC